MTLWCYTFAVVIYKYQADVAELVYAHDSGSCPRKWVRVRVPSSAIRELLFVVAELDKNERELAHKFVLWKGRRTCEAGIENA